MLKKALAAACAAVLLASAGAADAQLVLSPGWFKTLPNGSTLTDTSAGVFSFSGGGNTVAVTLGSGNTFSVGTGMTVFSNGNTSVNTLITGLAQGPGNGSSVLTLGAGTAGAKFQSITVGASNSCSSAGQQGWVTDASVAYSSSTRGGQITGSGVNGADAYCDGSVWRYD